MEFKNGDRVVLKRHPSQVGTVINVYPGSGTPTVEWDCDPGMELEEDPDDIRLVQKEAESGQKLKFLVTKKIVQIMNIEVEAENETEAVEEAMSEENDDNWDLTNDDEDFEAELAD